MTQIETRSKILGLPAPVLEHRFHPVRRFRLDYAWPDQLIGIEYEGLCRSGPSRHTTYAGYTTDCEKYNLAILQGWKVFRITAKMVNNGQLTQLLVDIARLMGIKPKI